MENLKAIEFIKNRRKSTFGLFYLMTVGVLLAWVMVAGIIDTTIFQRNHGANLIRMFFIVGIFGMFFFHKYLTRVGIVLLVLATIFITSGFFHLPEEPNIANRFAELISQTIQFLTGNRPYHTIAYETVTIWAISLFFGFFVVFFSYRKFNFWLLFITSAATTSLAVTSPYFRELRIFYTYAFCLLALVIKYLYEKNTSKMTKPPKGSTFIKIAVPLIAGVVLFASTIPRPPTIFTHGSMRDILRAPFDFVNDIFLNITQQSEFSLRQIGFGESGGRLGGDIEANDQVFMRINSNVMPLYLTGATRDTYTGYSWLTLHSEYHEVDFDAFEQNIEFAEWLLSFDNKWLLPQIEVVASGRLVQIDIDDFIADQGDQGYYFDFSDPDNRRIFIDESTDQMIWVDVELSDDWQIDFTDFGFLHPPSESGGQIEVNNLDRRLTTIFHTGILENIDSDEELSFLRNRDGRLLSERRLRSNTNYTIYYHSPYHLFGEHSELDYSYRGIFQDISDMFQMFRQNYGYNLFPPMFVVDDTLILYEELLNDYFIPRAERIHEIYTTLPDDFPERVGELALEVTEVASSNYEKMRLLESFLSESFEYTLTPGPSLIDQDFVYHFLFDLQRGYCVHFATAFVTMARSLGMPTRYVEGFYVNLPNMLNEDVYVLSRMAHAWPEVYFEGYGWHRFEPTPASGMIDQLAGSDSSGVGGAWPNPEDWYFDDIPDFIDPNWSSSTNQNASSGQQGIGAVIENMMLPSWAWVGIVLLLIVIVASIRVVFVLWRISRIRKKDNNEIAIYRFKVLLSYLKFLGFTIKDTETAIQFTGRIQNSFSNLDFEKEMLRSSSIVFAKARYSKHEISEIECNVLEKLIGRLDTRMQLELGKGQYFVYRFILAKV